MNYSTPGLPVHQQLLEFTQTHVHWVNDAIQPSHPLSSPSPPALNLSQHQGSFQISQLFASGGQSTGVAASTSVLPTNIQDWSPLAWTGWIPCSPRDCQESSPTPQFKSINSSVLSFLYPEKAIIPTDTCTLMFTAALFTISRTWKQSNCPSTVEWIHIHIYNGILLSDKKE